MNTTCLNLVTPWDPASHNLHANGNSFISWALWEVSGCVGPFVDLLQVLVAASLGFQCDSLPWASRPSTGSYKWRITLQQLIGNHGPVTGSMWHWPPIKSLPRGPRTNISIGQHQTTTEHHSISSTSGTPKVRSWQATDPTGANPTPWVNPCTAACMLWPILTASKPKVQV